MEKTKTKEKWLPLPGYEGRYEISNIGRVKSITEKNGITILLPTITSMGYKRITFENKEGDKRWCKKLVHHLVALTYIGPRPKGYQINHINGIKTDNRVTNLEYVTPSENTQHAFKKGLTKAAKGSKHGISKITEEDVKYIRAIAGSIDQKQIAKEFNISEGQISNIINNKCWNHVR